MAMEHFHYNYGSFDMVMVVCKQTFNKMTIGKDTLTSEYSEQQNLQ